MRGKEALHHEAPFGDDQALGLKVAVAEAAAKEAGNIKRVAQSCSS